jgi:hypothetical protein
VFPYSRRVSNKCSEYLESPSLCLMSRRCSLGFALTFLLCCQTHILYCSLYSPLCVRSPSSSCFIAALFPTVLFNACTASKPVILNILNTVLIWFLTYAIKSLPNPFCINFFSVLCWSRSTHMNSVKIDITRRTL